MDLEDIKRLRKSLGLTQKELAIKSGVSQSLIAKIEAQKIDPTYSKAKTILETLNSLGDQRVRASDLLNASIISVSSSDSLHKSIQKMKKYDISQMPVIEDKKVVGLVSEAIILDGLMNSHERDEPVRYVMKDAPPTITKTASLNLVTQLLREYPIVLVGEKGKLKGQITKADILSKAFK